MKKLLLLAFAMLVGIGASAVPAAAQVATSGTCTISASGQTCIVPNTVGGLIATFEEKPAGSPATVSVTVQGCMRGGTCDTAADTNTSTSAAIRPITFTKAYNYFLITASWTGGTNASITINNLVTSAQNGGGSGGAVNSVFGRIGTVVANAGDYNFTQISGNINVSQMNSGTLADSTHFWRGDGTWATAPGGTSTPCTVTAGSLQYNNAGAFGCATQWTTDATTITASSTGVLDLSAAPVLTGLRIPAAAGAVPVLAGRLAFNTTNQTLVWGLSGTTTMVGAAAATGTGTATTCTNQFISAISAIAVPTCTGLTLAGPQFANQGSTTTVFHGNGAGNGSFGAVTSSDVNSTISIVANRIDQNNAATTSAQLATVISDEVSTGGAAKVLYGVAFSGNGTTVATTTGTLTNQDCVKIDAAGNLIDSGGTCGGTSTVQNASQYSMAYYSASGTTNTISGLAAPTSPNGVAQYYASIPSGGLATAPVLLLAGVAGRTVSGTTDTILATDRAGWVTYTSGSAVAVTLPSAASFTGNFVTGIKAKGAGAVTITPATSTIDGNATLVIAQGQNCTITSLDGTNYESRCSSGQITGTAPIVLTASANGGAFGCPSCLLGASLGVGILHVAGSTQTATSGAVDLSGADVTNILAAARFPALTGDATGTNGSLATTVVKVNGVAYGTSPSTNTVPVVTSANTVTYQTVPNAALANSSTSPNGQTCNLGSSCNVNVGAAVNSVAINNGNGSAITGVGPGTTSDQILAAVASAAPVYKSFADLMKTDYVAGGGTAQAQTVTLSNPAATLSTGLHVFWKPAAANTSAAPTLAVSGTTATAITKCGTTALVANDLTTTAVAEALYDGTQYQLLNPQAAACGGGASGVTSVTGTGIITNSVSTGAVILTVAGTSGGVPYFSAASTWASSAALAANALTLGGGAGNPPSTVAGLASDGVSVLSLGVAGTSVGGVDLKNATSGTLSLRPVTGALGTPTVSVPAVTGTLIEGNSDTTTTHVCHASATAFVCNFAALVAGDLPSTLTSGTAITNAALTTPTLGTPASGTLTNVSGLPVSGLVSATGAIPTIANGNNPWIVNCALTSGTTCETTGETTASTTAGAVLYQFTTLTTSTAIPVQITQGAAGPANAAAPAVLSISAAAAGGAASASNAGSNGAAINLLTGAGSAGGATTGIGGNGGIFTLTEGVGGNAGGTATNNGGTGGAVAITTGAGGNGGTGAATAGSGGGFTVTLGAPGTNSATGTAGTVGKFNITGTAPASTANAAGVAAGTTFQVTGVAGGASSNAAGVAGIGSIAAINGGIGGAGTGTNAVGGAGGDITLNSGNGGASAGTGINSNGGSVVVTLGAAGTGGSGTPGKAGVFRTSGPTAGFFGYTQGSAVSTANTNIPANTAVFEAPAAVTAYVVNVPAAAPTNNNSALIFTNATPGVGSFAKIPQTTITTGTAYTNATTTFSNVAGSTGQTLQFAVEASTNYAATCQILWQGSAGTTGPKFQWTGPASPTNVSASMHSPVTTSTYLDATATAFSSAMANTGTITTATNFMSIVTLGLVNGANAGTVTLQAAANGVGTLTIQDGSFCVLQ